MRKMVEILELNKIIIEMDNLKYLNSGLMTICLDRHKNKYRNYLK